MPCTLHLLLLLSTLSMCVIIACAEQQQHPSASHVAASADVSSLSQPPNPAGHDGSIFDDSHHNKNLNLTALTDATDLLHSTSSSSSSSAHFYLLPVHYFDGPEHMHVFLYTLDYNATDGSLQQFTPIAEILETNADNEWQQNIANFYTAESDTIYMLTEYDPDNTFDLYGYSVSQNETMTVFHGEPMPDYSLWYGCAQYDPVTQTAYTLSLQQTDNLVVTIRIVAMSQSNQFALPKQTIFQLDAPLLQPERYQCALISAVDAGSANPLFSFLAYSLDESTMLYTVAVTPTLGSLYTPPVVAAAVNSSTDIHALVPTGVLSAAGNPCLFYLLANSSTQSMFVWELGSIDVVTGLKSVISPSVPVNSRFPIFYPFVAFEPRVTPAMFTFGQMQASHVYYWTTIGLEQGDGPAGEYSKVAYANQGNFTVANWTSLYSVNFGLFTVGLNPGSTGTGFSSTKARTNSPASNDRLATDRDRIAVI